MSVWQLDRLLDEEDLMEPKTATSLTVDTLLSVWLQFGMLLLLSPVNQMKSTGGWHQVIIMDNELLFTGMGDVSTPRAWGPAYFHIHKFTVETLRADINLTYFLVFLPTNKDFVGIPSDIDFDRTSLGDWTAGHKCHQAREKDVHGCHLHFGYLGFSYSVNSSKV